MRKTIQRDLDVLLDPLFIAASDVPVAEDSRVVRGVQPKNMMTLDDLTYQDEFIKLYRKKMKRACPELVDYFCT